MGRKGKRLVIQVLLMAQRVCIVHRLTRGTKAARVADFMHRAGALRVMHDVKSCNPTRVHAAAIAAARDPEHK